MSRPLTANQKYSTRPQSRASQIVTPMRHIRSGHLSQSLKRDAVSDFKNSLLIDNSQTFANSLSTQQQSSVTSVNTASQKYLQQSIRNTLIHPHQLPKQFKQKYRPDLEQLTNSMMVSQFDSRGNRVLLSEQEPANLTDLSISQLVNQKVTDDIDYLLFGDEQEQLKQFRKTLKFVISQSQQPKSRPRRQNVSPAFYEQQPATARQVLLGMMPVDVRK